MIERNKTVRTVLAQRAAVVRLDPEWFTGADLLERVRAWETDTHTFRRKKCSLPCGRVKFYFYVQPVDLIITEVLGGLLKRNKK
jgi:hypothetical protein